MKISSKLLQAAVIGLAMAGATSCEKGTLLEEMAPQGEQCTEETGQPLIQSSLVPQPIPGVDPIPIDPNGNGDPEPCITCGLG